MNEDDIFHKSTAGPTVYPITAVHWAFLAFFSPPNGGSLQVMPMVSGCIYAVNVADRQNKLKLTISELAFLIYRIFYIWDGIIVCCFIASKRHEQD